MRHLKFTAQREEDYVIFAINQMRYFCQCIFTFAFSFERINVFQESRVWVCMWLIICVCMARLVFVALSVLKEYKEPTAGVKAQPLAL